MTPLAPVRAKSGAKDLWSKKPKHLFLKKKFKISMHQSFYLVTYSP
jgi:hypothetical protein